MVKAESSIPFLQKVETKRVSQSTRMAIAYVCSTLIFFAAIIASYSILHNIITTQKTLTKVNTLVKDIQVSMTDSIGVLNDFQEQAKKSQPNLRLLQLISRRASDSVIELDGLRLELKAMDERLEDTHIWDESKWIVELKEESLNEKLNNYIYQMKILTSGPMDTEKFPLPQIPVEAAGARNAAMFVGYQRASDLLEEKLDQNSSRIETVHRTLTGLTIGVIILISIVVVVPLWRRVIREHNRLEEAHGQLADIAYLDLETGLPNLVGLQSHITELNAFTESEKCIHLLLVRFKNLDELYHLIGSHKVDELLQSVSRRLQNWDNSQLQWCRSGEAEFSALISEHRFTEADEWIQALYNSLTRKLKVQGIIVRPQVSLATSRINKSDAGQENLLMEHLSNARLASVNFQPPICWLPEYQPAMQNKLAVQNNLINRISEGISKGEFLPHYQIKFCAKTGTPCSLEVLARWQSSDGTMHPPSDFIPAAESSGLIIELTYSLFDQVMADIEKWCSSGLSLGRVAINISDDVLHHSEFLNRLNTLHSSLPVLCDGIEVEITENVALGDDLKQTKQILQHIRGLGIHVAIDDFGTGYASLQTLLDLPVDVLKIDRSFVLPMTEQGSGSEVVSAMISLSNMLKKRCVVEGVETQWQWTQLAELGADELQGFYFHRPASYSETSEVLHHHTGWKMTG